MLLDNGWAEGKTDAFKQIIFQKKRAILYRTPPLVAYKSLDYGQVTRASNIRFERS